jgi:hypothetical protein
MWVDEHMSTRIVAHGCFLSITINLSLFMLNLFSQPLFSLPSSRSKHIFRQARADRTTTTTQCKYRDHVGPDPYGEALLQGVSCDIGHIEWAGWLTQTLDFCTSK